MSRRRRKRKKKPDPPDRTGAGRKAPEERKPEGQEPDEKKQKKDEQKKGKRKSPARNLVETIVVVVVLVLVLRLFLVEAFKIPSSSMEPTLLGHPYHGDRVLAWKPSVTLSSPGRWSVCVFVKHPDRMERANDPKVDDRNFIKRVVGLPGDRLLLAGGDVFVRRRGGGDYADEYLIKRKPASVQEEVWLPVYESRFDRDRPGVPPWRLDEGLAHDPDQGRVAGRSDGTAWARFAANHYEDDKGLVTNLYLRESRLKVTCPHCATGFQADFSTSRTRVRCPTDECGKGLDVLRDDLLRGAVARLECPSCRRQVSGRREELAGGCPNCGRPLPDSRVARATSAPGRYPLSRDEEAAVADIRVSFDVRAPEAGGCILVELSVDEERYVARVPLGGGTASLSGPAPVGSVESQAPVAPFAALESSAGQKGDLRSAARRVSFAKVDQALVLCVDGEELIRKECDVDWRRRAGRPGSNSVRIGIEGAGAAFERVRIERDLHYLPRGNADLVEFYSSARRRWLSEPLPGRHGGGPRVGAGDAIRMREELGATQFVMLGDNSPSSYDGRMWPPVEKGDMVGRAFFLFWPPARMRRVR